MRTTDLALGMAVAAAGRLGAALAASDVDGATRAGMSLIGLGPGLTPSGDDLLVGLTAALTAMGDPGARRLAGAWATEAVTRTTEVAAAFHRCAATGEYSERLHLLLDAILVGPPEEIAGAVAVAADWGATSGIDTLAGVVLALRRSLP